MVISFIDDHKDRFGVEPICRVLNGHGCKIAPSTYYAAKARPASARAIRDAALLVEINRVFHDRELGRGLAGRARCGTCCAATPASQAGSARLLVARWNG